jgi:uncharacterized protein (TIGR02145 family)
VPVESLDLYKEAPGWNTYKDDIVGYIEVDGEIVIPSPEPPETPEAQPGDYVDEYGINHGQGVEIDGVVWAPVNCGYHATDYKYGKLYQWGRKYGQGYDGPLYDEGWSYLGEYADATTPELLETSVSLVSGQSEKNAGKFYYNSNDSSDWLDTQDDALWNAGTEDSPVKTECDPCPFGWRVPTDSELYELTWNHSSFTTDENGLGGFWFSGTNSYTIDTPQVFFPAAGYRNGGDGYVRDRGCVGHYWSSTPGGYNSFFYEFWGSHVNIGGVDRRASGRSVRCVKK